MIDFCHALAKDEHIGRIMTTQHALGDADIGSPSERE
jgi:hypothetical protein